jgi:ketosteroid isomerase-like protein
MSAGMAATGKADPAALEGWHAFVASRDPARLHALLAEDAVFHSPVVHTPQRGRAIVEKYLVGAMHVLGNASFRYEREIVGDTEAMLEFVTEVDGTLIDGVDIIRWNEQGLVTDFKVMVRPLKAMQVLHQKMGEMLQRMG